MGTYRVVSGTNKAPSGLSAGDQVVTSAGTYEITGVKADGSYTSKLVNSGQTIKNYSGSYSNNSSSSNGSSDLSQYVSDFMSSLGYGSTDKYMSALKEASESNTAMSVEMANSNNEFNAQQAALSREFNAAEAEKNRAWQQEMSNSAHQREVADLQAAGLNPVLSVNSGASVGSGATASSSPASGTHGEVDRSFAQAMASMVTTLLQNQISMTNNLVSAQNQLAVADRYNATSELVSRIAAAAGIEQAGIHAGASMYASDQSLAASKYVADKNYSSSIYSTDEYNSTSRYGIRVNQSTADKDRSSRELIAALSRDLQRYGIDENNFWNFLSSILGTGGRIIGALG